MKTFILSAQLLLLVVASPAFPQDRPENYCKDPSTWTEWEEALRTRPGDLGFRGLYALRIGLCVLVERGELTTEEGTEIFEEARLKLLKKREMEELKDRTEIGI